MQSIIDGIIVQWGWRRDAIALLAGAASALAFAPFDAVPVLWITMPVLVFLLDGAIGPEDRVLRKLLPAAAVGWWFGFGFFLVGLWWLGVAFLVEAEEFAWLMPLAIIGLPAGLALFFAFGAALARAFWSDGWPRILILAVALTLAEWLRGNLFTGLPWNVLGYAAMPIPLLMQSASLVGLWGMTFFAVLVFSAPALLFGAPDDRRPRFVFLAAAIALLLLDVGFGAWRITHAGAEMVEGVRLRVVQPNISQSEKWQPANAAAIFKKTLDLSASTGADGKRLPGVTHLIWPETAFPFFLTQRPDALVALANLLPTGTRLIAGAARTDPAPGPDAEPPVYNSIYVINDAGEIDEAYDKVHLVPFGEYLPFQQLLESFGLRQLTRVVGGFSAGSSHRLLGGGQAPAFAPLVCYEAIFPGEAVPPGARPGWLVNVTNDAWYGNTPGPRQHLRQVTLRAVEQGLPLVRSANNGISAVIDPYGRSIGRLELGTAGILDSGLPKALTSTIYARFGDAIPAFVVIIAAAIALFGRALQRQ